MDWAIEKTLTFIEDYRQQEVLWRISHPDYKNRLLRRDAMVTLASKHEMEMKNLVNKIKNLRSYFHKEHIKVKKRKSGSSSDEVYTSSWFAYKALLFIADGDEMRAGIDTFAETNLESQGDSTTFPDINNETTTEVNTFDTDTVPKQKKRKKGSDPTVEAVCGLLQTVNDSIKNTDQFSIFGEYVASRLRNLNNPTMQAIVQQRINTTIFEAELEILSKQTTNQNSNSNADSATTTLLTVSDSPSISTYDIANQEEITHSSATPPYVIDDLSEYLIIENPANE